MKVALKSCPIYNGFLEFYFLLIPNSLVISCSAEPSNASGSPRLIKARYIIASKIENIFSPFIFKIHFTIIYYAVLLNVFNKVTNGL